MAHDRGEALRKMTELLRTGAVMLDLTCPICGLPLFRLKSGEIVCPIHGRVHVVSSEEEARRVRVDAVIEELEELAATRLSSLMRDILTSGDEESLLSIISKWLDIIEKCRRIRSTSHSGFSGHEKKELSADRRKRK